MLPLQVSLHFRGPLQLKQFAAYVPGTSATPKMAKRSPHERRHAHGHAHFHDRRDEPVQVEERDEVQVEERAVGDWVTATINGKVVSWQNTYTGATSAAVVAAAAATTTGRTTSTSTRTTTVASRTSTSTVTATSAAASSAAPSSAAPAPASGAWTRSAYYSAEDGTADGLTFLNNMGGQGSGTWRSVLGANTLARRAHIFSALSSVTPCPTCLPTPRPEPVLPRC